MHNYHVNPPEPIVCINDENPNGLDQCTVDEHIYEQEYEAQQIRDYADLEDAELSELIKNEPSF